MESNDQVSYFDEIIDKINALQDEDRVVEDSKKLIDQQEKRFEEQLRSAGASPVDTDLFEKIKEEKCAHKLADQDKSPIRRLLDGDEDENEEGDELPARSALYDDVQEDIEDYESAAERDEIYRDLKNTVGKMAVKSLAFFALAALSLYLLFAGFHPVLFGNQTETVWYPICFLAVDLLCLVLSLRVFSGGLLLLLRGRASTDTLLALLWGSLMVVRVCGIIRSSLFPVALYLEPMLVIGLYFNVLARKKIASNIKKNFKQIAADGDKLTVTLPPCCETNNDLILETGEGGDVLYAHKTGLVSRFIDHSYSDFEWDQKGYPFFFMLLVLIAAGTIALSQLAGAGTAILFPAAALAISTPFFARYFYGAAIWQNGRRIRKNGGVLTSAASAKKLEDADLVLMQDQEFLGEEAVLLQGVKALGDMQIDTLITNLAALFRYLNTPLKPLFMKMIDQQTVALPRVDDIYYHEGLGYSCLIHSKLFLVGSADLMRQFHIPFADKMLQMKFGACKYPVCVSYHKSPAGVFIVSYERYQQVDEAISLAEKERVSVGVVTKDFHFDRALLEALYRPAEPELFHFISTKTGEACLPLLCRQEKSADLLASRTGMKGIMAGLLGASKLLTSLKINLAIRFIYAILSLTLIFFIALNGFSVNTTVHILIFQTIWLLPVYLVCTFCK